MLDYKELSNDDLHWICLDTINSGKHGSFIESFCTAFMKADPHNKQILREAMIEIAKKYGLHRCTDDFGRLRPNHAKRHGERQQI